MNSLEESINKFQSTYQTYPQKHIKHVLQKLQTQVDHLKNTAKAFFDNDNKTDWNGSLDSIKDKLVECEKRTLLPEKTDLLQELNVFHEDSVKKLDELKQIPESLDEIEIKLIIEKLQKYKTNSLLSNPLIDNTAKKLKKLKTKMEQQLFSSENEGAKEVIDNVILRIKKLALGDSISIETNVSSNKDKSRIEKYGQLETAFTQALKSQSALLEYIDMSLVKLSIMPEIKRRQNQLDEIKKYLTSLNDAHNKIKISSLSSGYSKTYDSALIENSNSNQDVDEKAVSDLIADDTNVIEDNMDEIALENKQFKRNFTQFLNDSRSYAKQKEKFQDTQETIKGLIDGTKGCTENVRQKLDEILKKIETIKNANIKASPFESIDTKTEEILQTLKASHMEILEKLKNEIINTWNQCCFDLCEIEIDSSLFDSFCEPNEKLTLFWFLAEDIFGDLRQCRKTEKEKEAQYNLYLSQRDDFNLLSFLIGKNINDIENVLDQPHRKQFDVLLGIYKKRQPFNLLSDCNQLIQLKQLEPKFHYTNTEMDSSLVAANKGFIAHGFPEMYKIKDKIDERWEKMTSEFVRCKENVLSAYKAKLPEICTDLAEEINHFGDAFYYCGYDTKFDHDFTNAFNNKNWAAKTLQKAGSFIKYGAQTAIQKLSSSQYQIANDDEEAQPENKYVFEKVKSPFDNMQIPF